MPLKDFEKEFSSAVRSLLNAVKNSKIAHAYLIHCDNPDLSVKFSTALAQVLSCKTRYVDGDACGKCSICSEITKGNYPELFTLFPSSKSRKIKIGEDESEKNSLRWFQSLFYYTATYASGKKIGIIMDADTMMPQAQNAFLKTLEEPPPNSHFIICTANPSELLPTFRSRCQRITILRNSQKYDFEECDEIINILEDISKAKNDLLVAEKSSAGISAVFDSLKQKASANLKVKWEEIFKSAENLESGARRNLEERFEAAESAEYMLMRGVVLSLIHTFFFEKYQIAKGISLELLPSPELIRNKSITDEKLAFEQFNKAEIFLNNMKLNVDEKLAIRAFCYSIIFD